MKIMPIGHRILVAPDKTEEVTSSGIVITRSTVDKEQQAQVRGTVVEVGEYAYQEYASPWCKKGDRVLYQRYAGMRIPDDKGGYLEDLLLLNDLDLTAILIEE